MDSTISPYQPPQTAAVDVLNRPRRLWLGVLLSFLCPGLGQLYVGRPMRALGWMVAFLVAFYALCFAATVTDSLQDSSALWVLLGLAGVLRLPNCVDAYLLARSGGREYALTRWNHVALYAVFAVVSIFAGRVAGYGMKTAFLETFRVPTAGMSPTILPGDRIVVNKLAYRKTMPRRGDICVYRHPDEPGPYVIRVIALPGDEIEIRDGRPVVNGTAVPRDPTEIDPRIEAFLQERATPGPFDNLAAFRETLDGCSYIVFDAEAYPREGLPWIYRELGTFSAETVPPECIFVLGDNRTMSKDSRVLGFVHARDIIGRMESRYWRSFDPERERRRYQGRR